MHLIDALYFIAVIHIVNKVFYTQIMKAIDFACRLLRALSTEEHSDSMQRVLLGLAAGLETAPDISYCLGMNTGVATTCLRKLQREELVNAVSGSTCIYRLSPRGKKLVASIFSFLPTPPSKHAQKKTPLHH